MRKHSPGLSFFLLASLVILPGLMSRPAWGQEVSIEKAGRWGAGNYLDVVVQGNYAYCLVAGEGIDVIDIHRPGRPEKVGHCRLSGYPYRLHINGNYAYVPAREGGLHIVDISHSPAVYQVGHWQYKNNGCVSDVHVEGNYAYTCTYNGLYILDVSSPAAPVQAGYYGDPERPSDYNGNVVYIDKGYAYVGVFKGRLEILDLSNPTEPFKVSSLHAGYFFPDDIYVSGGNLYFTSTGFNVIDGPISVLRKYDISNPETPVYKGSSTLVSMSSGIFVKNSYVYICLRNAGLCIMDVPWNLPGNAAYYDSQGEPARITVKGNIAYVAAMRGGLEILDVSEPTSPALMGKCDHSGPKDYTGIKGNYVYGFGMDRKSSYVECSCSYSQLSVTDISVPSSPSTVNSLYLMGTAGGLAVGGNYLYTVSNEFNTYSACDEEYYLLSVFDISNPAAPVLSGTLGLSERGYGVVAGGTRVYVHGQQGFSIIDVSVPSAPAPVGAYSSGTPLYALHARGDYVYTESAEGLSIIDVTVPSAPSPAGVYTGTANISGIYAYDDYVYVMSDEGLKIVDVSNPASPQLAGQYDTGLESVGVFDGKAYAWKYEGEKEKNLQVLDVSDPTTPVLLAEYAHKDNLSRLCVSGDYIYTANGSSGKMEALCLENTAGTEPPRISLNRTHLCFGFDADGTWGGAQRFTISNGGGGTLEWEISTTEDWLHCTPVSGGGRGEVIVTAYPVDLSIGTYTDTITVTSSNADNSGRTVTVEVSIYDAAQASLPFGEFSTPAEKQITRHLFLKEKTKVGR